MSFTVQELKQKFEDEEVEILVNYFYYLNRDKFWTRMSLASKLLAGAMSLTAVSQFLSEHADWAVFWGGVSAVLSLVLSVFNVEKKIKSYYHLFREYESLRGLFPTVKSEYTEESFNALKSARDRVEKIDTDIQPWIGLCKICQNQAIDMLHLDQKMKYPFTLLERIVYNLIDLPCNRMRENGKS